MPIPPPACPRLLPRGTKAPGPALLLLLPVRALDPLRLFFVTPAVPLVLGLELLPPLLVPRAPRRE